MKVKTKIKTPTFIDRKIGEPLIHKPETSVQSSSDDRSRPNGAELNDYAFCSCAPYPTCQRSHLITIGNGSRTITETAASVLNNAGRLHVNK